MPQRGIKKPVTPLQEATTISQSGYSAEESGNTEEKGGNSSQDVNTRPFLQTKAESTYLDERMNFIVDTNNLLIK